MDFELNEDQRMIKEATRDFAQEKLAPLAQEFDEKEKIPKEIYKELADLGYMGMLLPEKYGGSNLDFISYILAMEEFAKACAALEISISVHNSLVCDAIFHFATEKQKEKYLPRLAKGEWIGAYSLTEPSAGTDAGSLKTTAILKGDHFLVNGTKSFVSNGEIADVFIIFVLTNPEAKSKGISCLIVEKGTEGFSVGAREKKMGLRGSDTTELSFEDCKIPRENLLSEENKGFKLALTLLDPSRIAVGAQSIGIAQAAFDEALEYSKQRVQFGQAICNFQAIQFKLADMATQIEAARLLVYRAAYLKTKNQRCSIEAAMAKVFASEVANMVVNEAVQIHGGYGYMKEYAVERYFRDARVTEIYEGTSEAQRIVISRGLLR
ncbi:MAG: acyl-CoA dehydrogenase [candidate division Zixibacteria bacterium SM23_73_2]|nr:MAG: acyl-CoA dehydrogenase [candidate division Zixibacteria bacterium SM23_73_2]